MSSMGAGRGSLEPWAGEPESLLVTLDTGDRIHYLDWGGTDEANHLAPLLLLHGLAQTSWSWAPVARRLRASTRVLAMDLRGHGLSDSPRSGYELESQAFDALTVLVANGWGHDAGGPPAAVAGHGLGALVAAKMAELQPDSVCALALVDAGWEDVAEATGQTPAEFEQALGDPPEVLSSLEAFLADRREFDPATWDADQERAARASVDEKYAGHVAPVTRTHALRGAVAAMFEYDPELPATLEQPLLIAVAESGAADDELIRDRRLALAELLERRREAGRSEPRIERYEGVGHNLMRYRPAELSQALLELLEEATHHRS